MQLLTNLVRAVVLVVALALWALQASPDLSTHTNTVALLDRLDLRADLDGLAYNLMPDTDRKWRATPSAIDGVHVGSADTAAFNLDINVVVTKDFGFELASMSVNAISTNP